MPWFKKNKSKSRRKPARAATKKRQPWDPSQTLARLKILAAITALILTGFAWHQGRHALTKYVSNNAATQHTIEHIHLSDAPPWMDTMLHHDLRAIVATHATPNPMDQLSLQNAVNALKRSPWVINVDQIRRTPGGHITVKAQYRAPVAFIQARDGYHMISKTAVRLPGLYLEHQLTEMNLPLITGAANPPPYAGQTWQGKDIKAGLQLIQLLIDQPYIDQIHAFDVATRDPRGRIHLVLKTHNGGAIRWGLPPGDEQPIEPGPNTKLLRIATLHQRFGSIDAGGKTVDIYGPAVFVHKLTASPNNTRTAHLTTH